MIKFKTGTQVPISDDGIIISDNKLGYDISHVRRFVGAADWKTIPAPSVNLVEGGYKTASFASLEYNSRCNLAEGVAFAGQVALRMYGMGHYAYSWLGFQLDMSALSAFKLTFRGFRSQCAVCLNDNFTPIGTNANPGAGSSKLEVYNSDRAYTEYTFDISEFTGIHSIYLRASGDYANSVYITNMLFE